MAFASPKCSILGDSIFLALYQHWFSENFQLMQSHECFAGEGKTDFSYYEFKACCALSPGASSLQCTTISAHPPTIAVLYYPILINHPPYLLSPPFRLLCFPSSSLSSSCSFTTLVYPRVVPLSSYQCLAVHPPSSHFFS